MFIRRRKGWEIPESFVTPEHLFFNRRQAMAAAGAATLLAVGSPARGETDPSAGLYPAKTNPKFADAGRPITDEAYNTTFNNYYEFGTTKRISSAAAKLPIRPWTIAIDGEVEKPLTLGIDDLLKQVSLEERIYRHRCVEAWSMVVPWTGFPLARLVEIARPTAKAKYVRFETFNRPEVADGQQPGLFGAYPWPYVEGVSMAEAASDLAFLVTGAYGKPVANSMGAPIRLHLPWKYGFKSIKAIVKVSFAVQRPLNFWQQLAENEYGFWANVNPDVPHPRWSQAQEEVIGTGDRVPTKLFNGYGDFVASLYAGMDGEKLYM
ncbi:MAG: protein-methionine-sulfoxide reductase catalytic subunit MsrP [Rhizobiales bacterium]|nr:protein-methionine-sulfoxide reductase catalytic subunit MsrP [Hyphomicrobiales bacterium]MBI3674960.1 protein-methionine-sulfoxide reductase catalytic subunit MsrP [Hyphomicrobiales bacterium]